MKKHSFIHLPGKGGHSGLLHQKTGSPLDLHSAVRSVRQPQADVQVSEAGSQKGAPPVVGPALSAIIKLLLL